MKKVFSFSIILIIALIFGFSYQVRNSKKFSSVKIGNQIWMAKNLDVDHYRNGDRIPQVQDKRIWDKLKSGAWCYYENDSIHAKKYGRLYNWYAVNDPRGLAPKGWHIPTLKEFKKLKAAVKNDGNALKKKGQGSGKGKGTNKSKFGAFLAGGRYYQGIFSSFDYTGNFWTSTQYSPDIAEFVGVTYANSSIRTDRAYKYIGFSIRCVKNR